MNLNKVERIEKFIIEIALTLFEGILFSWLLFMFGKDMFEYYSEAVGTVAWAIFNGVYAYRKIKHLIIRLRQIK